MKYLLGIDLGTSGTKTVLFDIDGNAVASKTVEYEMFQPKNGWAEQNPEDWWNACVVGIKHCISGITPSDIKGIGISGQMHGLVILDKDGCVLRNSIIWCDGRTSNECTQINEIIGEKRLIEITANPALTGFTASKILWVKNNEPEIYEKCRHILLPKDYIRYKLTGEFATEVSDASGMQLLDVPNRCWSDEVLGKLGIDRELLGKMYESYQITGEINKEASSLTGLSLGTPVVGGAGDNFAAAIGTGVVSKGKAFTTLGTSGVVFAHSDKVTIEPNGRIHTFCSAVPGAWCVMSCTLAAGLSLRWTRDTFCQEEIAKAKETGKDVYYIMDKMAAEIPAGSDRLFYLPYLMGERSPHLDENARGAFIGLSAIHTKAHLIRSVLEGVIYSQNDCVNIFKNMGVDINEMLVCGGGARSKIWREMIANIYNCKVETLKTDEGPALGVAILAGVGCGIYDSVESACEKLIHKNSVILPEPDIVNQYSKYYNIYKTLYPVLKDSYKDISLL